MKTEKIKFSSVVLISAIFFSGGNLCAEESDGKSAFDTYCSGCHPEGKNPQNPAKSLLKMDREANGVKDAEKIIQIMRSPGKGMRQFSRKDIPERTAREIAEYIIKTFN